ncbi:MAG: Lrp/AsnC family transcriptional regulator [Armatimonadetes bacterium]|nr:Lrp/AsnC family transcriptional regulator [Armatimonadota bacterium]
MAVTAVVLLKLAPGKARAAIKGVARVRGVREAHVLTGPYDGICMASAKDTESLGDLVVSKIQRVNGVVDTLTCLVV